MIICIVDCLVEETKVSPGPLDILLNFVPKILVFEELVPLALCVCTQRMIDYLALCRSLFLFCFDLRLNDELLPPDFVSFSRFL